MTPRALSLLSLAIYGGLSISMGPMPILGDPNRRPEPFSPPSDNFAHVEVKGRGKGTRRARKASR